MATLFSINNRLLQNTTEHCFAKSSEEFTKRLFLSTELCQIRNNTIAFAHYFAQQLHMETAAFLSALALHKAYKNVEVVAPINFNLQPGCRLAIAGETGSGKSTLLKMIAGQVQPDGGSILFMGNQILGPNEQLLPGHKGIAYLSQHFELRNNYIVADLLDYGSELNAEEQFQLYRLCEIDHLLQRKTNSGLSGGERQRIALAKILTTQPKLLLLDEPFSNLDTLHKQTMRRIIANLQNSLNIGIIMISHDTTDMLSWANEMWIMQQGKVVQRGTPIDIYYRPASDYVAGLFGVFNRLPTTQIQNWFPNISNEPTQTMHFSRPEQWKISLEPAPQLQKAHIENILFEGPTLLLYIRIQDQLLYCRTMQQQLALHQTIFVGFEQH